MKTAAVLIAFFIALSLYSPVSVSMGRADRIVVIVTLDVCNSTGASLASRADIPAINEAAVNFIPPISSESYEPDEKLIVFSILSSQKERPPKA